MTEAAVHVKTEERPSGSVATVTIDNQQRLNCLASPAIISLRQAFERLSGLEAAVRHWLGLIGRATPKAVRNQKALMNRWERVSVEEGVYAGIDAISEAYTTGEPQAAIKAFFDAKKQKSGH